MDLRLTKTAFLQYLKCPAEFWLEYHEPLLSAEPITLEHEHLRQQGYDVEAYARQMKRFNAEAEGVVDFQRVFQTKDLAVRCDVVVSLPATGEVDIYEIKASASVKDEHFDDVAFQTVTAERMGFNVRRTFVITVNADYIRRGEIDVEELFNVDDVTESVRERIPATEEQIRAALAYLQMVPVASLTDYCIANKLDCRFLQMHLGPFPEYTVFDISFLKHEKRRELLASNILEITDVPDDFPLSPRQRSQVAVAKSGEPRIDREKICERMDTWEYPLQFLDYETFAYAVPQFDGIHPFQQMCFQYSLHTIDRPGAEPRHSEFLSRGDGDPPREMAEHLREAMAGGIGTVFVWYENFEKSRNSEMAAMYPDLADFFNEVNAKTYDLMTIFSDDLYVHPGFKGKTSIKKVLPVLCPHLDYKDLGIGDGMTATIMWYRAAKWTTLSTDERTKVFNDLLEYCELDSLAMVEIYRHLVEECLIIESPGQSRKGA